MFLKVSFLLVLPLMAAPRHHSQLSIFTSTCFFKMYLFLQLLNQSQSRLSLCRLWDGWRRGRCFQKWADEPWRLNTCEDSRTRRLHQCSQCDETQSARKAALSVWYLSQHVTTSIASPMRSQGTCSAIFCWALVIRVTLDVLAEADTHSELWWKEYSPCELYWLGPALSEVRVTGFFDGELLRPVLEVVYISLAGHRSCEVAAA